MRLETTSSSHARGKGAKQYEVLISYSNLQKEFVYSLKHCAYTNKHGAFCVIIRND
ncbi:hypothethical protein [Staphylococcus caprae]|uniref:Hypothethical protein n=1 Tax=Staphylococcus caprae TaxID=29380 RepID=A0ABM7FZL5_9STAP|nr:hypothethical protein [Staphylococcus caprae]BBD93447.1 hypothethical protein [Staphylococcus caprae]BBD95949.1 hypothetical protein JMUB898_2397 [Staphylococcus caprae]